MPGLTRLISGGSRRGRKAHAFFLDVQDKITDGLATLDGMGSFRTDDWKLIYKEFEENELYNLKADPFETRNLIKLKPNIAAEHEKTIEKWLASNGSGQNPLQKDKEMDTETFQQLKALGYIK